MDKEEELKVGSDVSWEAVKETDSLGFGNEEGEEKGRFRLWGGVQE